MFTASFYQVTPAGTAVGEGISKSPKQALRKAEAASDEAYRALCAKTGLCLSVGVDGWVMHRGTSLIGRRDNF